MQTKQIDLIKEVFSSRLDTLSHLLQVAENESKNGDILQHRLAPDMLPFGTQIAFTCNQPRSFAQWCNGAPIENLKPEVTSFSLARDHVSQTKALLGSIDVSDAKLDEIKRVGLGPGRYAELSGHAYVHDFLIPNFYFHLTTTYAILRMVGAQIGKTDFMLHLVPHVKQTDNA
jgi:hypothetical protein